MALSLTVVLYAVGFILVIVGIGLIVLGFLKTGGRAVTGDFGGVILIGPFPIILGSSGRIVRFMVVLAVIFIILMVLFTFLPHMTF